MYFGINIVNEVGDWNLKGKLILAPLFKSLPKISFSGCNKSFGIGKIKLSRILL